MYHDMAGFFYCIDHIVLEEVPVCFGDGVNPARLGALEPTVRGESFFTAKLLPGLGITRKIACNQKHLFMIAFNNMNRPFLTQLENTFDDALRLRSSINQITQENELIIRLQRQFNQERFQGLQTAMYIANRPNTHGGDLPSVDIQLAKPG